MAVPKPRRVTAAATLIFATLLVLLGAMLEANTYAVSAVSPSPLNPLPGGTQLFYHDLSQQKTVVLGGPETLGEVDGTILYLVIGVEKPFSRAESRLIAKAVETGRVRVLVADETGNTRLLLEELRAGEIDGIVVNRSAEGEWAYVVPLTCGGVSGVSTLVARVAGAGGEVYCTSMGETVGIVYPDRGVMVVGDSSVFANYLYGGEYPYLPSTRSLAWTIMEAAGLEKVDVVVWDNAHYDYKEAGLGGAYATRLVGMLFAAAEEASVKASQADPARLALYLLVASLPWPVILLFPSRREEPVVDETGKFEEWLVSLAAERVGAKTPGAPLGGDPSRVARRILGRLER